MLGKQFSTCKYKKWKLLSVTTGKLFEGYDYWWEEDTCFYQVSMFIQHFHSM